MYDLCQFFRDDFRGNGWSWVGPYSDLNDAVNDACNRIRGCPTLDRVRICKHGSREFVRYVTRAEALSPEYNI